MIKAFMISITLILLTLIGTVITIALANLLLDLFENRL